MSVTTRARVKRRLDMLQPGATENEMDTKVDALIVSVTAAFESYLGLPHLIDEWTEVHSIGPWQNELWLRTYQGRLMPAPTITSVKTRTHWREAWADITALDTALFALSSDFPGMLVYDGYWPEGRDTVQVILESGFAEDTDAFVAAFPALADAADSQCAFEYMRRTQPAEASISGKGLSSTQKPVNLLPSVLDRLQPYMRVSIP